MVSTLPSHLMLCLFFSLRSWSKRRWSLSILHTHTQQRPFKAACCPTQTYLCEVVLGGWGVGTNALFTVPLIPLFTISRTAWASVLFSQPFTTNACESWNRTPSLVLLSAACESLFSPCKDSFISKFSSPKSGRRHREEWVLHDGILYEAAAGALMTC